MPTRSTITDEVLSDSSRPTSIAYLPIGPGLPGLHVSQPVKTAAASAINPAAANGLINRFFINSFSSINCFVLALPQYKTHSLGQSQSGLFRRRFLRVRLRCFGLTVVAPRFYGGAHLPVGIKALDDS